MYLLDILFCNLTCDSYADSYADVILVCYYVYFLLLPFYKVVLLEIKTISERIVFSFLRLSLLFWFLVFLSREFLALYFNTTSIAFVEI